jgi:hypothetical protein
MAKSRKAPEPETPFMPQVGDKVIPERSDSTFVITSVRSEGRFVDLNLPGTNLDRFHVDVQTLKFVDKVPRPKQAALNLRVEPDADQIMDRIDTIQRENLQRLDDDIELSTKYLKTEGAPAAAIKALESMRIEQRKSWEAAVARIKKTLGE